MESHISFPAGTIESVFRIVKCLLGNKILRPLVKPIIVKSIYQMCRRNSSLRLFPHSKSSIIIHGEDPVVWHYLKFMLPSKSFKSIIALIHHVSHCLMFMHSFYKSNTANSEMFLTTDWLINLSFEQNNWQEMGTHYRTTLFIETKGLKITCKTNTQGYSQF